jgi:2-polyprenyl-6-methoxyphenol hydroxylase-like FAD-dependent oxidoreductase
MLGQDQTQEILDRKLAALGVAIERGARVVEVEDDGAGVQLAVRHAGEQGERMLAADWVVGCDGAHSLVRRRLGVAFEGEDYGQDWLMSEVRTDAPLDRERFHVFSYTAAPMVMIPLPCDRWRVSLPQVPNREGDRRPPDMDEIRRLAATRGPVGMTFTDPTLLQCFRCYRRSTKVMRRGRLLVAGDAAHIHSPAGGQGMNTGLQDAFNLGWKLALVTSQRSAPQLLDTYQEERVPVASSVLDLTHGLVRIFTLASPRKRWLRDRLLPSVMAIPPVQRRFTRRLCQISHSYRGGPLAPIPSPGRRGSLAAGDRLPCVSGLRRDGRLISTLDLLSSQAHTLLVLEGERPDAEKVRAAVARFAPWGGTVHVVPVSGRGYGAPSGQLMLVRPDGHLGCLAPLDRPDVPERYLRALTGHATRAARSGQVLRPLVPVPPRGERVRAS